MRITVLLPEPFGPNSPKILPRSTENDTRSTAVKWPKRFVSSCVRRIGTRASQAVRKAWPVIYWSFAQLTSRPRPQARGTLPVVTVFAASVARIHEKAGEEIVAIEAASGIPEASTQDRQLEMRGRSR